MNPLAAKHRVYSWLMRFLSLGALHLPREQDPLCLGPQAGFHIPGWYLSYVLNGNHCIRSREYERTHVCKEEKWRGRMVGPGWASKFCAQWVESARMWADTWHVIMDGATFRNLSKCTRADPGDQAEWDQGWGEATLQWLSWPPPPRPPLLKTVWPTRSLLIVPMIGLPAALTD